MKVVVSTLSTLIFLIAFSGNSFAESTWRYLSSNVHAYDSRGTLKASYAGYISPGPTHTIIPVNTKVSMKNKRNGFTLILEDGRKIVYEVHKARTGMTGEEYYNKILTSKTKTKISALSSKDKKGIKSGIVSEGMTRKGARIAYGFPSPHATPEISGNVWIFWKNRFAKTSIAFNNAGIVKNIK